MEWALVALTGFAVNLNHITLGVDRHDLNGFGIWLLVIVVVVGFNVWAVRLSWTQRACCSASPTSRWVTR